MRACVRFRALVPFASLHGHWDKCFLSVAIGAAADAAPGLARSPTFSIFSMLEFVRNRLYRDQEVHGRRQGKPPLFSFEHPTHSSIYHQFCLRRDRSSRSYAATSQTAVRAAFEKIPSKLTMMTLVPVRATGSARTDPPSRPSLRTNLDYLRTFVATALTCTHRLQCIEQPTPTARAPLETTLYALSSLNP